MFWIVCNPSSGSIELYLTEIRSSSLKFFMCLVGVWQRNFEPVECVCVCVCMCVCVSGTKGWEIRHYEFQSSTALYSLMMDRIRSETCCSVF